MSKEQRNNNGVLFPNHKRTTEKAPNMRGQCRIVCPKCGAAFDQWVSAWTKTNDAGKFLSLAFQDKDKQNVQQKIDRNEEESQLPI